MNGHLEIAQWLWSLDPTFNVHQMEESAFRYACKRGYLKVAQWLWSLDHEINIHIREEEAFRWSCYYHKVDVAEWLLSLNQEIDVHAKQCSAFLRANSFSGHEEVIHLLVAHTVHDPVIRYVVHRNNSYIIGIACTPHVHQIGEIPISSVKPSTDTQAQQMMQSMCPKKSARSAIY